MATKHSARENFGLRTSAQVKRISLITGKSVAYLVKLGSGNYGEVYLARIHWEDGTSRRVAVKTFKPNGWITHTRHSAKPGPMTDSEAHVYQQTIDRLRKAGVRMPKMGMYKVPVSDKSLMGARGLIAEKWVLVSELYGSTGKKSKLKGDLSYFPKEITPEVRLDLADQLTRIANAGFLISNDCVKFFKKQLDRKAIIADIDAQFGWLNKYGHHPTNEVLARTLVDVLHRLSKTNEETLKLFDVAISKARPDLKEELEKLLSKTF